MNRKLVRAGGSLAVTLPVEVVREFKLKKVAGREFLVFCRGGAGTTRTDLG